MYSETLYCRETELPIVLETIEKKTSNRHQKHAAWSQMRRHPTLDNGLDG